MSEISSTLDESDLSLIKLSKIISCSSEDDHYSSVNLLVNEEGWRSGKIGLDQINVVIKLDQEFYINWIEIGNHHSAFVEVWVSKNETNTKPLFEMLLSPSSFMTPNESRFGSNINRVRSFKQDNLSPLVSNKKWDLIKITCTQPFNKTVNYGIKFIRLKGSQTLFSKIESPKHFSSINLGSFTLKPTSLSESDDLKVGSFFSKRNQNESEVEVEKVLLKKVKDEHQMISCPSRKKQLTPAIESNSSDEPSSTSVPSTSSPLASIMSSIKRKNKPIISKTVNKNQNQPFNKLLSNVVFAISGFQNPLRSEIRNKGIEMGAKYKPNWDSSCTHLICAFPNTPKYNRVMNTNGIIVTKEWFDVCYKEKKLISHKYYLLKSGSGSEDSEDLESKDEKEESSDESEEEKKKNEEKDDDNNDYEDNEKIKRKKQNENEDDSDIEFEKKLKNKKDGRIKKRSTLYSETDEEENENSEKSHSDPDN